MSTKNEKLTVETNKWGTITFKNKNGDFHNEDGPAIIFANGDKEYFLFGCPCSKFQHSAEVAAMKPPVSKSQKVK